VDLTVSGSCGELRFKTGEAPELILDLSGEPHFKNDASGYARADFPINSDKGEEKS